MLLNLYSDCTNLTVGCKIYQDTNLTIPVPDSFYSNGIKCYTTVNGIITAVDDCVVPCDIVITNVSTTDPTLLGGTDGTITVNFTTTHGTSTYTLNGIFSGVAASPLTITGLSSNTQYTVVITDSSNCQASTVVTLGQSATRFDADWIMVTYEFTNGSDLDTRTRIALPDIGQDTQDEYLGWTYLGAFDPPLTYLQAGSANPANHTILWGGDNTGTGFESILINVARFKTNNPGATSFTVDLRSFWYGTPGTNPVVAAVTLWKGGTPVRNGCVVINQNPPPASFSYCWTNPGAQFTGTIDSVPKIITLGNPAGIPSGQRVATLKYDLTTFIAVLNNNDTTTPSV